MGFKQVANIIAVDEVLRLYMLMINMRRKEYSKNLSIYFGFKPLSEENVKETKRLPLIFQFLN